MEFNIDASDFREFARDCDNAAAELLGKVEPTIMRGAGNVQRAMKKDIEARPHFKQISPFVTFDVDRFQAGTRAEIGPTTAGKTAADLYHIGVFGGARGGGGTIPDPESHLEAEAPAIERYVGDILEELF